MIAYVDSSVLSRAYLRDEVGHHEAVEIVGNLDVALITGTWTRVEVTGALVRAARSGRGDEPELLAMFEADVGEDGPVLVVGAEQAEVETEARELVRTHGLKSMGAWHLATALLTLPGLAERHEPLGFASRDAQQASVAKTLGFQLI